MLKIALSGMVEFLIHPTAVVIAQKLRNPSQRIVGSLVIWGWIC